MILVMVSLNNAIHEASYAGHLINVMVVNDLCTVKNPNESNLGSLNDPKMQEIST